MLFYERCYILVEGDTEENALPLLYRRMFKSSLFDDGIRLINLHGHGASESFLSLLGKNRQRITLTLIDNDAKSDYENKLKGAGFDEDVIPNQLYWIGEQEFEDAFNTKYLSVKSIGA
jgi:predicted ATP-dependent endonuclease of OLD family